MATVWPWKKNFNYDGQEQGDGGDSNGQQQQQRPREDHDGPSNEQQPDERTRLLQPHYLSPDDPAVSPYNLWTVRALSGLSLFFLLVTFVWWIVLLVSTFVSPPMMYTRGSGFLAFSYAALTVAYLIVVGRLFFAIPSQPLSIWGAVLAILLLVDTCILLAVPRIRVEEGWAGIATVIWATVIALYTIIQNRTVANGKREEEQRLTGREETRRSLCEWIAVLAETVIVAVMVVATVLLTATLILRARDASLSPPGRKYYVSEDKYQVHLACVGNTNKNTTTPTILLEGDHSPVEHTLQPFIDSIYRDGSINKYCYWDRPGYGWSDNAPSPFSAGMAADALSEALSQANEKGPWILVSAGTGGIYSRIFASHNLPQVHGILLIDTLHEDLLDDYIGGSGRGFFLWLRGILSPLGIDRVAGALFRGRTREDRVMGRSAYQSGKVIKAKLQENLIAESMTKREIQTSRRVGIPDTPLVVVSSGIEVRNSKKWAEKQEDLKTVTDRLVAWDVVEKAPHEVWGSVDGRRVLERRLRELLGRGE
ncbi:hypothetical protein MPDQ_004993 [Monascus purpureus]|uniref:Mitochondrial integral membrane protein n=1 Tax=Monascus purpureus TaxID=5098 RepID=A0A507QXJ6_MONPU|nr:hypothetical protein MPDQ_004993 [Monascus purpureus]BDD54479.1 hypothetical protein MAP00_000095 [Monascus purpureus]